MQISIRCFVVTILFALQWFVPQGGIFAAELTNAEKKARVKIENLIRTAARDFAAGKFEPAGKSIQRAMEELDAAMQGGSPDLWEALQPTIKRISRAHTLLEFEGVALPPFQAPVAPPPSDRPGTPQDQANMDRTGPANEAGFTDTVAPILVRRCGSCHIAEAKGKFSMASYAALMKGPPEGVVVFAGDVAASRLIETIETGDMPRGGGKVTPSELATLKQWIARGASFDRDDPNAPIDSKIAPPPNAPPANAPPANAPRSDAPPMVGKPTGSESVSFAKDIAPLLIDHCSGCHLDAMTTRGGLRMDTFAQLLRGGDSGPMIQPGDGQASLLIAKLRGTEGQRMPAGGRPPLPEQSIELIRTWIDEGATLDGADESQPLTVMSQLAWATSATSEEISARRQAAITRDLQLAVSASDEMRSKSTEHFYLIGPVSDSTIELVAQQAEEQMGQVASLVARTDRPIYRGKATIVVLPKRYDYSEFAKMIEQRSLPAGWTSHWKFDGINAYVAVVASDRDDGQAIADRLAAPLVSLAVATQGSGVPAWFADGVGAAPNSKKPVRGDRNAKQRAEAELRSAISAVRNAEQFLAGNLTPQQSTRTATAIVASMLEGKQRRSYEKMMLALSAGAPFDEAFLTGYSVPVETYIQQWLAAWR